MSRPVIEVQFRKQTGKGGKTFTKVYWREARNDGTFSRWIQIDTETAKKALKEQKVDGESRRVVERD